MRRRRRATSAPMRRGIAAAVIGAALAAALAAHSGASAQSQAHRSVAERVAVDSPYAAMHDAEEAAFVEAAAKKAIAEHCAACHGPNLEGRPGVPDLTDYDFLWGITLEETNDVGPVMELERTILYGIRNQDCPGLENLAAYGDCPDTRYSEMPAFAEEGALSEDEIREVVEYVLSLSGRPADAEAAARGKVTFDDDCTECHGDDGRGYKVFGGPNLTDGIWLYGGDRAALTESIEKGRLGRCPAWVNKLDEATIKSLAIYIWLNEH